jgi:hypothetical protein
MARNALRKLPSDCVALFVAEAGLKNATGAAPYRSIQAVDRCPAIINIGAAEQLKGVDDLHGRQVFLEPLWHRIRRRATPAQEWW